jgi:hypothetical protein
LEVERLSLVEIHMDDASGARLRGGIARHGDHGSDDGDHCHAGRPDHERGSAADPAGASGEYIAEVGLVVRRVGHCLAQGRAQVGRHEVTSFA